MMMMMITIIITTQHVSIKIGACTWAITLEVLTEITFRFCVDPLQSLFFYDLEHNRSYLILNVFKVNYIYDKGKSAPTCICCCLAVNNRSESEVKDNLQAMTVTII